MKCIRSESRENTKEPRDLLFSDLLSTLLKRPLLLVCVIDDILASTQQLAFHCLHKHRIINRHPPERSDLTGSGVAAGQDTPMLMWVAC